MTTATPDSVETTSPELVPSSDDEPERNCTSRQFRPTNLGGRRRSDFWTLFTELKDPQLLKSAVCRHCKAVVNYYKKSEQARGYLLKCYEFRKYIKQLEE